MRRTFLLFFSFLATFLVVTVGMALFSPVAPAIPAFARKTGLSCSACHEVWPRLNDFGQLFRDRGYRLERDRDLPTDTDPSYWPIAMRTTVGYQWVRQQLVPTDTGTTDTQTGTFGFTGLDVFSAGALGNHLSYLITFTPGLAQSGFQTAPSNLDTDLESAFIGFHDILGTPYLNLRVGKHAPDLPIDEHRTITLTQGYNIYHFHPQGSVVTWEPGNNQNGFEIYGHSDLSRFRYSFSLVNENDATIFSNSAVSNPVAWGHITGEHYFGAGPLAAVKVGVFGSAGWHSSQAATLTDPTTGAAPIPGTGYNNKSYYRYGGEAHLYFLNTVNPITLSGIVWGGSEDQALIANGTQTATFLGGVVEGVWTVTPRLSLVGRWEHIANTQQGDPTLASSAGNLTAWTGVIRHTFEMTSRTEAALHLEFSKLTIDAGDGTTPATYQALAGIDFAL
jgi:hypothetical protein